MSTIPGFCFGIGDEPRTVDQVEPALRTLRPHLTWGIRTYSTVSFPGLGPLVHGLGLKLAAGAWLNRDPQGNHGEIQRLLAAAQAGAVDLAVVGNETLFRQDLTAEELIALLRTVRAGLPPAVPLTTGELADRLLEHPEVLAAVDVVGMHHYPYWDGVAIDRALDELQDRYHRLQALAAPLGKPIWILETGWPSAGNTIKAAEPTPANAARYFNQVIAWTRAAGIPIFYFEAVDEGWKVRDEGPQGAHWGVWTEAGERKFWLDPPLA